MRRGDLSYFKCLLNILQIVIHFVSCSELCKSGHVSSTLVVRYLIPVFNFKQLRTRSKVGLVNCFNKTFLTKLSALRYFIKSTRPSCFFLDLLKQLLIYILTLLSNTDIKHFKTFKINY